MEFKLTKKIIRFYNISRSILLSQYSLMIEYRAEIAMWALSGILPLIMMVLWNSNRSLSNQGLDYGNLKIYFISVFIVRQFTAVWVMISFEEDHLEGKLSPYLLQPIFPFWRYFYSHIAEQISRLPIVVLMISVIYFFIPEAFNIPSVFLFIKSFVFIFFAFCLRFLLHWLCSMLCFWNDKASSIERLLLIPYIFLSGLIAPLESFPYSIKVISLMTPFPYMIAFPARILSGQVVDFNLYLTAMLFWTLVFISLSRKFWRLGIRKYSGMGI